MATDDRQGFRPARHLAGGQIRTKRYPVYGSGVPIGLAIGDAVRFNPNGDGVTRVSGDVVPTVPGLGVVVACYDSNNKPLTFSQPTRGPFIPGTNAVTGNTIVGYVDVVDDPNVSFIVQADATVISTHHGQFVSVTAATGDVNTAAGTSKMQIKMSTVDTSVRMFQIIGWAPDEAAGLGTVLGAGAGEGQTNANVEVVFAAHSRKGSIGTTVVS